MPISLVVPNPCFLLPMSCTDQVAPRSGDDSTTGYASTLLPARYQIAGSDGATAIDATPTSRGSAPSTRFHDSPWSVDRHTALTMMLPASVGVPVDVTASTLVGSPGSAITS